MTNAQLLALKTEVTTDPNSYGYASMSDSQIADAMNLPRAAIVIRRTDITMTELLEAIDDRDIDAAATPAQRDWFAALSTRDRVRLLNDDGSNTRALTNLSRYVSSDTQGSRTRLTAIASRLGSRAEQLFGRDFVVSPLDVGMSRSAS